MNPIQRLRKRMSELDVPAALVSNATNVGWLTGFTGSTAVVLITQNDAVFISDSRYREQAKEQVRDMELEILQAPRTYPEVIAEQASRLGIQRLGFEAEHVTFAQKAQWEKKIEAIELYPVDKLCDRLRMKKFDWEIEKIRQACGIADACYSHVQRLFQPGVAELDIAIEIEFFIRRQGAKAAFDVIAVSGPRSARPHGTPSERKLEEGDFLTLDFGACVDGYNSDITRTVVIGQPSEKQREIYNAVLEAQLAAIDAIRPGAEGKAVDAVARDLLSSRGLGEYFGHGLGHGLGRLVHDPGSLATSSEDVLEEGMVFTVEPGVYIEGFGGVRIEDDVVVRGNGAELLTHSPKDLDSVAVPFAGKVV